MKHLSMYEKKSYNSLFGIADANREWHKSGGDETVGNLLSVIADAGLGDVIGLRLLHKHNDIYGNELMLETAALDSEGFFLSTSPVDSLMDGQGVCNSWQLTKDGFVPVEFSTPSLLAEPYFDMHEHRETFEKLAKKITAFGVEKILGPCINYSKFVASYSPAADSAFLEKTDSDKRANVVRYVEMSDPNFLNSTKTKWHARKTLDASGAPKWLTACSCFCSVMPQGGHQGTTTHRYSGDDEKSTKD